MSGGVSWLLFPICVNVQADTFPISHAMCHGTLYHGARQATPTEGRRPHYTDGKMPRCFLQGLIRTAAHLSSGQGVMDTQLEG